MKKYCVKMYNELLKGDEIVGYFDSIEQFYKNVVVNKNIYKIYKLNENDETYYLEAWI